MKKRKEKLLEIILIVLIVLIILSLFFALYFSFNKSISGFVTGTDQPMVDEGWRPVGSTSSSQNTIPPASSDNCNGNIGNFDKTKCEADFEGYTGISFEVKLGDDNRIIDKNSVDKAKLNEYRKKLCDIFNSLTLEQRKSVIKIKIYSDYFVRKDYDFKSSAAAYTNRDGTIRLNDRILFNKTWIDEYPNILKESFMHEVTHLSIYKMRKDQTGSNDMDSNLDREWRSVAGNIYVTNSGGNFHLVSGGIVYYMNPSTEFPAGGFIYKEDVSKPDREKLSYTPKYGIMDAFSASLLMEDIGMFADNARFHPDKLKDPLSDKNQWYKIYRSKLDMLYKYGIISCCQYSNVLKIAGLPVPTNVCSGIKCDYKRNCLSNICSLHGSCISNSQEKEITCNFLQICDPSQPRCI